jgi:hypothetical protein
MRSRRVGAAIALGISVALLLSGCSNAIDLLTPPPVWPQPPPAAPVRPIAVRPIDTSTPAGVRAEIVRWFTHAGYRRVHVEALVDYAAGESGFRPCATNGPSLRYTFQWTGERLRRLDEFARAYGQCPPLDKQLAFADHELRTEPNYWCFWRTDTRSAAVAALRRGFGRGRC